MIDYLQQLSLWHWLAFGTALLIFEVFGAAGYLLWAGLVAALIGLLSLMIPGFDWVWQIALFATLSAAIAALWWRHQRNSEQFVSVPLGQPLVGRTFVLHEAIVDGRGSIRVGEKRWHVSGPALPAGTPVRVIGHSGKLLSVEAIRH